MLINNINAYEKWGIVIDTESIARLLMWPSQKNIAQYDPRFLHGRPAISTDIRFDSRTVSVNFLFEETDSLSTLVERFDDFMDTITNSAGGSFSLTLEESDPHGASSTHQLGRKSSHTLLYKSTDAFTIVGTGGNLSLQFLEGNPAASKGL